MTLQIGRITGLNEPVEWDSDGTETVTVTGSYLATSVADGLVKRDQLLSYPNIDEPIIPVILAGEPRVTGYYRPISVQLLTDDFTRRTGKLYDYRMTLQRVAGFTQPMFEAIISGALLTNKVGGVLGDTKPFFATSTFVTESVPPGFTTAYLTRVSADGALNLALGDSGGTATCSGSARFTLPPANFYAGAAMFEQGSPLAAIVGRNLTQQDLVNWRLSNGLVRVTPNATAGKLDVSHYNGTTWSAVKTYVLSGSTSGTVNGWNSVTILRNAPEEVVIRLSCTSSLLFSYRGSLTLDIALRRGDRLVRMYVVEAGVLTNSFKLARNSVEAATAVTFSAVTLGGIRATANDADGNRYTLFCYQSGTPTTDLVNGSVSSAASRTTADFAIGSEIAGSSAIAGDQAANLACQYLAAQSETQRIVGR